MLLSDHDDQLHLLERHLNSLGQTIRQVARDGLCILRSLQEVLKEKSIILSIDELKTILRNEVSGEFYSGFSTHNEDPKTVIETFLNDPEKHYVARVVDIVLPALMHGLKAKGTVSNLITNNHIGNYNTFSRQIKYHSKPFKKSITDNRPKDCFESFSIQIKNYYNALLRPKRPSSINPSFIFYIDIDYIA